jgi:hypothetical protein
VRAALKSGRENALKRKRPKEATCRRWPKPPPAVTDFRVEQDPEAEGGSVDCTFVLISFAGAHFGVATSFGFSRAADRAV